MGWFAVRLRLLSALATLAAMFGVAEPVFAVQATLVADAHVNSALPAVNSGAISNLYVGAGDTALLQFDLGVLPSGTAAAQVSKAVLRVYCNRVDTSGLVSVQPVQAAWGEYSLTYASLPSLGAATQVASVTQAGSYIAVDVTTLVQGWITAPATNFGVALTAGTAAVQFDSKENDLTGHSPELEVMLASQGTTGAAGPQGAQGMTGPAGATGPQGPAGATGLQGPAGATGPQGLKGDIGPPGPPGPAGSSVGGALGSYQGTYSSVVNYGAGDVVAFQGSSYTSLSASNHGNTPGLSPRYWGVLALGATGATGAQGPQGVAGPPGLTGPQGPAGPTGAAGAAGTAGAKGAPGLVYQGTYNSSTNYALGDVVMWNGASWASLVDANHGNTPSFSPGQWGMLTAQGPIGPTGLKGETGAQGAQGLPGSVGPPGEQGPQGAQGIPGQAGAQGLTGANGPQGLQGPAGPQGVAGPVGLSFRSAYSSAVNYGLADGVSYNGAGYVSLVPSNQGNTPDQSPAQWALFAAAGAPGATGPPGATGAQGSIGPAGPQGLQGVPGMSGATGPQGPPVANYLGNYASGTNYGLHDAVSFGGSTYISLVAGNVGNTPGLSPTQWAVLAAQGPRGPSGLDGVPGPAGPAGTAGAPGTMGPQGPPVTFQGGWVIGTAYSLGDIVSYGGSGYVALVGNAGRQPDVSPSYWGLLAQAGAAGPAGATGPLGLQGPTGYPGATGAAGPAGPQGSAGATGPSGPQGPAGPAGPTGATGATGAAGLSYKGTYSSAVNYALNDAVVYQGSTYISLAAVNSGNAPSLTPTSWGLVAAQGAAGPAGAVGATGPQGNPGANGAAGSAGATGSKGPAGVVYRGAWSGSTSYAVGDAVLFSGTSYIATASAAGLQPDLYPAAWGVLAGQGVAGPTGPSGTAATVTVGTVTTGLSGTQASVTNSGSPSAAVLNFTIPQGAAGTNGSGGGASASSFLSMYHAVSFTTSYYSVNNPNASASEGPAVLTWVPAACTATSLTVFSQQSNAVTVTLRTGTPGSMSNMSLACIAASNGGCSVMGSVPVAAGSFVDLSITGASGTPAGVWTAVGCN